MGCEVQLILADTEERGEVQSVRSWRQLGPGRYEGTCILDEVNPWGVVVRYTSPSMVTDWLFATPPPVVFHPWHAIVAVRLLQTQEELRDREREARERRAERRRVNDEFRNRFPSEEGAG